MQDTPNINKKSFQIASRMKKEVKEQEPKKKVMTKVNSHSTLPKKPATTLRQSMSAQTLPTKKPLIKKQPI